MRETLRKEAVSLNFYLHKENDTLRSGESLTFCTTIQKRNP